MKYIIKATSDKFVVVHKEGPLSGCNAIPGALTFPTQEHASFALDIFDKVGYDVSSFEEQYYVASRLH